MSTTPQQLVHSARKLIGTPFHHAQRTPGRHGGVDCSGLFVCVCRDLGIPVEDSTAYPREVDSEHLMAALEAHAVEVSLESARPGDVLAYWYTRRGRLQHLGMLTEIASLLWTTTRMVHAHARTTGGAVREEVLGEFWSKRLMGVWRLKETS